MIPVSKGCSENQIVYVFIMPAPNRSQTVEGLLAQYL